MLPPKAKHESMICATLESTLTPMNHAATGDMLVSVAHVAPEATFMSMAHATVEAHDGFQGPCCARGLC